MEQLISPELKVVASPELMQRGCVYVIGLDPIKTEIGDRWEKNREAVWAHLERLLHQRLSPTDFFARIDDISALVSLPSLTAEEAQICCLRVAQELHTCMLGPCATNAVRLQRALPGPGGCIVTSELLPAQIEELARRAGSSAQAGVPSAEGEADMEPRTGFVHRFRPLWDSRKEAITTYGCYTLSDCGITGTDLGFTSKMILAATLDRIRHAGKVLTQRILAGDRFLTCLPVAYEMIGGPSSRMEIVSAFRELDARLRPYLLIVVSDIPYGVPQSRMAELVSSLRPFCRGVMIQLPARIPNYSAYSGIGLYGIGLSLAGSSLATPEMFSEIFKLGLAASKQYIASFVLDLACGELLKLALDSRITFMSGPVIGPALDAPASIRRMTVAAVCRQARSEPAAA